MTFQFPSGYGAFAVELSLVPGAVYYLVQSGWSSQEPHFFVALNVDMANADEFVLVNCTSQIAKAQERAMLWNYPAGALVHAGPAEYGELTKQSVFDCNKITVKTRVELVALLEHRKLAFKDQVPEPLLIALRAGVRVSPEPEQKYKDLLL